MRGGEAALGVEGKLKALWAARVGGRLNPAMRGYVLVAAGTASLCAPYVISKVAMREINSESFNVVWFGFGFLITLAYLGLRGHAQELRIPKKHWKQVALLALVNSVSMGAFFKAVELIDPVLVSFFFRLETVSSILVGVFLLGERLGARELGGMILVLGGAGIITYASGQLVLTGMFIVFFSAVCYTMGWLVARSCMAGGCSPTALAGFRAAGACVFLAAYVLVLGRWQTPNLHVLLLTLGGAFFGPFLANVLNYRALSLIGVARMSILRNLQPLFLIPIAYLFLGTVPGLRQLVGGAVVLGGVVLMVGARMRPVRV